MARVRSNRLYGTVELLILRSLDRHGPMHGLDVARRISDGSDAAIQLEEGALYPALHRLQKRGAIEGQWLVSEQGRRTRVYRLTGDGRRELEREMRSWIQHIAAIRQVLGVPDEEPS